MNFSMMLIVWLVIGLGSTVLLRKISNSEILSMWKDSMLDRWFIPKQPKLFMAATFILLGPIVPCLYLSNKVSKK